MRAQRFVREYASYKVRVCMADELMQPAAKKQARATCTKTVYLLESGAIGTDEAILRIMNCAVSNPAPVEELVCSL